MHSIILTLIFKFIETLAELLKFGWMIIKNSTIKLYLLQNEYLLESKSVFNFLYHSFQISFGLSFDHYIIFFFYDISGFPLNCLYFGILYAIINFGITATKYFAMFAVYINCIYG